MRKLKLAVGLPDPLELFSNVITTPISGRCNNFEIICLCVSVRLTLLDERTDLKFGMEVKRKHI